MSAVIDVVMGRCTGDAVVVTHHSRGWSPSSRIDRSGYVVRSIVKHEAVSVYRQCWLEWDGLRPHKPMQWTCAVRVRVCCIGKCVCVVPGNIHDVNGSVDWDLGWEGPFPLPHLNSLFRPRL